MRIALAVLIGLVISAGYLAPLISALSYWAIAIAMLLGFCGAAGWYRLRSGVLPGVKKWLALSPVIAALLFAFAIPLPKDAFSDVTITATGLKNPRSMSSEVFVRLVSEPVAGLRDFDGHHWEKRGDVFVSFQSQPSVLSYRGEWSPGAYLRLVRHPYSGFAEVRIAGVVQRLDLYSEKASYVDVPLPNPSSSWKGYLQRFVIALALGLVFIAIGQSLAGVSIVWCGTFVAAALVAGGTLWMVKDLSYVGLMEIVAFSTSGDPVKVEMNAGHGFTQALTVPVKGGKALVSTFPVLNPLESKIGIKGGTLRFFRTQDVDNAGSAVLDNGCVIRVRTVCLYEVMGAGPVQLWLEGEGAQRPITLPENSPGSERMFLLVERQQAQISVSASRAYLQLSPWEHFSHRIRSLRVLDSDNRSAEKLARVVSDGVGTYRMFARGNEAGEYNVPIISRADTGSFVGMKVFTILISISFVLLCVASGWIATILVRCFRNGQRLNVIVTVIGCGLWLGVAIIAGWPAIMGWDGLSPYIQAETGQISLWYGIGYPMIVGAFLLLGQGWLVTLWSIWATATLLLGVAAFQLQYGSGQTQRLAPIMLLCFLPFSVIPVAMMTHLRDSMNGLVLAIFSVSSFCMVMKWPTWTSAQRMIVAGLMVILGAFLALLRIDNLPILLVLLGGVILYLKGINFKSLTIMIIVGGCWIGISPLVEPYFVPNRDGAAMEKRQYESTALINPLTGMLVYGRGRVPEDLLLQIQKTLDMIMDVDVAQQRWTPYNIIYWHQTTSNRATPTAATNKQLRALYVEAFFADPALFLHLRLATFGATLGHSWFEPEGYQKSSGVGHPSFHDHLLSQDSNWKQLTELSGFEPTAHPFPSLTRSLLDWSGKVASSVLQLVICIGVLLQFRKYPLTAVIAAGEMVRAAVFFLFEPASVFLYLYDLHLLGFLLPMLALLEQSLPRNPTKIFSREVR